MNLSRKQLALHLPWLFVGFAVPAIAFAMSVHNNDQVAFQGIESYQLPEVCLSRRFLGITCPGCGLTRSIIFLVHGNFAASYAIHHMGWLIFLMIIAQIPYRIWCLWGGRTKVVLGRTNEKILWGSLVSLLFLNAILRWLS